MSFMFFILCTWVSLYLITRCRAVDLERSVLPLESGDLCYIIHHKSSISGDRLYFMGGNFTFEAGVPKTPENRLYWLDLNSTLPIDTVIPGRSLQSITVPGYEWQKQGKGDFLTDTSMDAIYFPFNVLSSYDSTNTLESFNTTSQTWSNVPVVDADNSVSNATYNPVGGHLSSSVTTSTSGLGLGFAIGGNYTDVSTGLVVLNASNPDSLSWTNETDEVPILSGGEIQYARYGKKGVLIAFGGYSAPNYQPLYNMSQIFVYDIDSGAWSNVTAGGDVPRARAEFCSTISAAPDDSSFQITIYGGWNINIPLSNEDVYVLSIPSFQWISISDQGNPDRLLQKEDIGRRGHTCNLYGDRQMIVLGGNIESGGDIINAETCKTSWPALRVLDTTAFVWQTQLNSTSSVYAVPEQVYNVIGGSASGNATMKAPPGGFTDSRLTEVFQKTIPQFKLKTKTSTAPDTPAPISNPTTTTSQSAASNSSSHTPAGSIVGSLVGGIASLLIITGGLLYLFYFRKQRDQSAAMAANPSELPPSHNVQELHGDHRPKELDGNMFLEIDGKMYVEAPAGELSELSNDSEVASSGELTKTRWGERRESKSGSKPP